MMKVCKGANCQLRSVKRSSADICKEVAAFNASFIVYVETVLRRYTARLGYLNPRKICEVGVGNLLPPLL
jgi:hypothetical protein